MLKKFEPVITNYILGRYWEDFPKNQITTTISSCMRIKEIQGLDESAKAFVIAYILSLLSLAVLRFSNEIITVSNDKKIRGVELGIFGGKLMAEERKIS